MHLVEISVFPLFPLLLRLVEILFAVFHLNHNLTQGSCYLYFSFSVFLHCVISRTTLLCSTSLIYISLFQQQQKHFTAEFFRFPETKKLKSNFWKLELLQQQKKIWCSVEQLCNICKNEGHSYKQCFDFLNPGMV